MKTMIFCTLSFVLCVVNVFFFLVSNAHFHLFLYTFQAHHEKIVTSTRDAVVVVVCLHQSKGLLLNSSECSRVFLFTFHVHCAPPLIFPRVVVVVVVDGGG